MMKVCLSAILVTIMVAQCDGQLSALAKGMTSAMSGGGKKPSGDSDHHAEEIKKAIAEAYAKALEFFCKMTIDQKEIDKFLCLLSTISPPALTLHTQCYRENGIALPKTAKEKQDSLCDAKIKEKTSKALTCVKNKAGRFNVDMEKELENYKQKCKK
ncbi:hypothetical protein HDE_01423 [Halotydeus destructor]|nr:hypothetical protein HDE_01423 [Halotydeus destructor]